jgi:hypothetical protein
MMENSAPAIELLQRVADGDRSMTRRQLRRAKENAGASAAAGGPAACGGAGSAARCGGGLTRGRRDRRQEAAGAA